MRDEQKRSSNNFISIDWREHKYEHRIVMIRDVIHTMYTQDISLALLFASSVSIIA